MTNGGDTGGPGSQPDDSVVPPLTDPNSREDALPFLRGDGRAVTRMTPDGDGADVDLGHKTLSSLARLRLFTAFFCWLADKQYPASHRPETRVSTHRKNSPRLYWLCVTLDVFVLVCVVAIALAAAARAVYKSIWL